MDAIAAWIVAGISVVGAFITLIVYVFKLGGLAKMVKDHDEWIRGQPERCRGQLTECEKKINYNRDQIDKLRNQKGEQEHL